ncbi:GNAT family N-acetyltransferase [Corynebacterium jeddahense]|uniref:Ribosomal N-acetyltransferase YdaF n=1 Tax=Corynebacterium jeddahense TaxID=1414719 RepID=A0ABY7UJC5_9CORY|nr:GNAT family protein [Corynebacterium jeddahense]WCZ38353.1 Putative ribosomal N-acetyltransferase YdaF [Corynebacterium jeddahense]
MFRPPTPGWPEATPSITLLDGVTVRLRPLTSRDGADWSGTRIVDKQWLKPVEPTVDGDWDAAHSRAAWRSTWLNLKQLAGQGTVVPLVIEVDGAFAGQVTMGNIQHGIVSECWIGYWVHSPYMGRGVATAACALGVDHGFGRVGLHRITATYLPDNPASGKVLAANGFREEGFLRRNLHIDGQWRGHVFVALNADDYPLTAVERLRAAGRIR